MTSFGAEVRRLPLRCRRQRDMLSALRASAPGPVHIVGGFLRDLCLGHGPGDDLDLVMPTGADCRRYLATAHRHGWQGFLLDEARSFVRLLRRSKEGASLTIDLAPLAPEGIAADLARRDCTANAMALEIVEMGDRWVQGHWRDPHGGEADLAARRLRPVALRNLRADPIRMVRMFRLGHTRHLELDREMAAFIQRHGRDVNDVNPVRLREEVRRLLVYDRRPLSLILQALDEAGLLARILPLRPDRDAERPCRLAREPFPAFMDRVQDLACRDLDAGAFWWRRYAAPPSLTDALQEAVAASLGAAVSRRQWWLYLGCLLGGALRPERDDTLAWPAAADWPRADSLDRQMRLKGFTRVQRQHSRRFLIGCRLLLDQLARPQFAPTDRKALHRLAMAAGWTQDASLLIDIISVLDALTACLPLPEPRQSRFQATCQELLALWADTGLGMPRPLVSGDDLQRWFGLPPGPEIGRLLGLLREAQAARIVATPEEARRFIAETR